MGGLHNRSFHLARLLGRGRLAVSLAHLSTVPVWLTLACAGLLGAAPSHGFAQPNSPSAEQLFIEGQAAFVDGRAAQAAQLFRRSLESAPTTSAAWNWALALRAIGEPASADEVLADLIAGTYGVCTAELVVDAQTLRLELAQRIGRLSVELRATEESMLLVDGNEAQSMSPGDQVELQLDVGEHRVGARNAHMAMEQQVRIEAGQVSRTVLDLMPEVIDDESDYTWLIVVGSVLLVGAAIALTVVLVSQPVACDPVLGCL